MEHFDTAEMYGRGADETLMGDAFHDRRDKVFIATKFDPTRDSETPIEETACCEIHPITAVQSEYSILSGDIEVEVIPAYIEVGATLDAYSPLGREMLSRRIKEEAVWKRLTTNVIMTHMLVENGDCYHV